MNKEKDYEVSEYSMFRPRSGRRLVLDYPLLQKEEDFKKLKSNELLFCWYYSHESSPLFDLNSDSQRRALATKYAFDKNKSGLSEKERKKYLEGDFSENMKIAMARMSSYRVSARVRALKMTETMFSNLESIMNIDANDQTNFLNKDGEVDISKKKAYVDTAKTAIAILPELVETIESGFSVESRIEQDKDDESSYLDDFHELKD